MLAAAAGIIIVTHVCDLMRRKPLFSLADIKNVPLNYDLML